MHIKELLKLETTNDKTEEDGLIREFMEELNKERIGTKYKPLTFMAVKMKLYAIRKNKQDLREFLSNCRDYKNRNGSFSKIFFGATKKYETK